MSNTVSLFLKNLPFLLPKKSIFEKLFALSAALLSVMFIERNISRKIWGCHAGGGCPRTYCITQKFGIMEKSMPVLTSLFIEYEHESSFLSFMDYVRDELEIEFGLTEAERGLCYITYNITLSTDDAHILFLIGKHYKHVKRI